MILIPPKGISSCVLKLLLLLARLELLATLLLLLALLLLFAWLELLFIWLKLLVRLLLLCGITTLLLFLDWLGLFIMLELLLLGLGVLAMLELLLPSTESSLLEEVISAMLLELKLELESGSAFTGSEQATIKKLAKKPNKYKYLINTPLVIKDYNR